MAGSFQSSTAHSNRPQSRFHRDAGDGGQRALPTRARRVWQYEQVLQINAGFSEKRRKCREKQRKLTGLPASDAIKTSAAGFAPNRCSRNASSVATQAWESFSYSAKARMNPSIVAISAGVAERIDIGAFSNIVAH